MKKLLLLATLLSAPTYADDDFCETMHNVGESLMTARQNGVDLPVIMGTLKGEMKELMTPIVIKAYEQPRYSTPEFRTKAISEFANSLQLSCMKKMG